MADGLRWIYLFLAIAGAVLPWQANLDFMAVHGFNSFDIQLFIRDANINAAARSLSRDLVIGATAISIWMVVEGRRLHVKHWWIALITSVSISFACGAPLFLYLRECRLDEIKKSEQTEP